MNMGPDDRRRFKTRYFDRALEDLSGVIETAIEELSDVNFDTLVGTGFSGSLVIPALATAMSKQFVLIRKEHDDSHHGGGRLVGNLGERWVFLDDFVSTGSTRNRVFTKVREACMDRDLISEPVGIYTYMAMDGLRWRPFEDLLGFIQIELLGAVRLEDRPWSWLDAAKKIAEDFEGSPDLIGLGANPWASTP